MDYFTPEKDKENLHDADLVSTEGLLTAFIIGDSISQGYTGLVSELLKDTWNVQRPKTNCGSTYAGLENIDEWVGDQYWDVIHFNWGLHDLCYRHPDSTVYGNRDKIKGTQTMSAAEYGENLEALVHRLMRAGKTLIWANTTIIPPEEAGRYEGDDVRYNNVAAKIMKDQNIPINDLHKLTSTFGPDLFWKPCDVHFSDAGYERIARQVADHIEQFGVGGK